MKKIMIGFFIICLASCGTIKGIQDTAGFINYFNQAENIKKYQQVRITIEDLGSNAKKSNSLSANDKNVLKNSYSAVQVKADNLYNKVVSDLMSIEKRKEMFTDKQAYFAGVNLKFVEVKDAYDVFVTDYTTKMGSRGPILAWAINAFIVPLGKKFLEEQITELIRRQLDQKLKPLVIIKPWDQI